MINNLIVLAWLAGILGAGLYLVIYGNPRRSADPGMGWHLVWTAAAGALQWLGLLLATRSLIPLLIADWLAVAIVYWRVALLINTRRRNRHRKARHGQDR